MIAEAPEQMLLGGLMMPLSVLPASVARIAGILPPAHAMPAYLGLAFRQETVFDPVRSLVILAASGLVAFGLAVYLFNWDSRNNARRGHPLMALLVLVPYMAGIVLWSFTRRERRQWTSPLHYNQVIVAIAHASSQTLSRAISSLKSVFQHRQTQDGLGFWP